MHWYHLLIVILCAILWLPLRVIKKHPANIGKDGCDEYIDTFHRLSFAQQYDVIAYVY